MITAGIQKTKVTTATTIMMNPSMYRGDLSSRSWKAWSGADRHGTDGQTVFVRKRTRVCVPEPLPGRSGEARR